MEPEQINLILLVVWTVFMALVFGLQGYFADILKTGNKWDWAKFIATIIYSLVVSYYLVVNNLVSLEMLAKPFADWAALIQIEWLKYFVFYTGIYQGVMYTMTKLFDPAARWLASKIQKAIGASVDFSALMKSGSAAPCTVVFELVAGNVDVFYYGDGPLRDGSEKKFEHTYLKAGTYIARAVQHSPFLDYLDRTIIVTGVDPIPTPVPVPVPQDTLYQMVVKILKMIWAIITGKM